MLDNCKTTVAPHCKFNLTPQLRHEIVFAPQAVHDPRHLRVNDRAAVGDVRIFYDIVEFVVHVLAIVAKSDAAEWLQREEKSE